MLAASSRNWSRKPVNSVANFVWQPANPSVAPDPIVAAWGEFKGDTINVAEAGRLQAEAVKLMDRAGYK